MYACAGTPSPPLPSSLCIRAFLPQAPAGQTEPGAWLSSPGLALPPVLPPRLSSSSDPLAVGLASPPPLAAGSLLP